ncbi:MAG: AAA family ATPase, partial [Cupriavidus sp.]|nr:AAA family ATPase [Cupriavidus sp.]
MIEIVFFSTNRSKLAHFRYLGDKAGVRVKGFHETTYYASYDEPEIDDREELLRRSYESALEQWMKRQGAKDDGHSTFFFEDTSVVVEALSKHAEVPGVNVKYWMREMTFSKLDALLKRAGNNRKVVVRSDIVMHLPQSWRASLGESAPYLWVSGETHGVIANRERKIQPNLVYPWLDDKTFNKWFVPTGANGPISTLDIEQANLADFRARAFEKIAEKLRKLSLLSPRQEHGADQLQLPSIATYPSIFIICGPSCAGKTTTATWMREEYNLLHIEASDFMHKAFWERHGLGTTVRIGDFAEAALQTQPGIVAQPIAQFLQASSSPAAVVTGFRSPREIEVFLRTVGSHTETAVMYLTASESIRLARAIARGRDGVTRDKFKQREAQEIRMGVADIARLPEVAQQANEGSLEDLHGALHDRYRDALQVYASGKARNPSRQDQSNRDQLEGLILRTLLAEQCTEKWLTTTEIAAALNQRFNEKKNKNNVSRYFNQGFHPYYEVRFRERDG